MRKFSTTEPATTAVSPATASPALSAPKAEDESYRAWLRSILSEQQASPWLQKRYRRPAARLAGVLEEPRDRAVRNAAPSEALPPLV